MDGGGQYAMLIERRERLVARLSPAARHQAFPKLYPRPQIGTPYVPRPPRPPNVATLIKRHVARPQPNHHPAHMNRRCLNALVACDVIVAICQAFNVKFEGLIAPFRYRKVAWARFAAIKLMVEVSDEKPSSGQIGLFLGGRDHTTILSGLKRANELHVSDLSWRALYDQARSLVENAK